MLTNLIVENILQYVCVSNYHIYTLNLDSVTCQLYLSNAGGKNQVNNPNFWSFSLPRFYCAVLRAASLYFELGCGFCDTDNE